MTSAQRPDSATDPVITIGVLADRVGLSVSAIRKYENEGMVIAHRTPAGHRRFSREDIDRVRAIHHLTRDLGLSLEAVRRMQALLPCWDLLPCSPLTRDACPAFEERTRPCWMIKGLSCAPQGNECRQCPVYRLGSLGTEDIKHLLREPTGFADPAAAIRELIHRQSHSEPTES